MTLYGFADRKVAETLTQVAFERQLRVHGRTGAPVYDRVWHGSIGGGGKEMHVAIITEPGGIEGGSTGEVTPLGGSPFIGRNASNALFEEGMQVFTFWAVEYPNEPCIYPYQFSECETPRPINVSPEV